MENGSSSQDFSAASSLNSIVPNSFTSTQKTEMENRLFLELIRDQELLTDLKALLDDPSAVEICKSLVSNRLLAMEKYLAFEADRNPASMDSSVSPRRENSALLFKNPQRRKQSKKRRISLPKWTNQVSVGSSEQFDGPPVDGYSWRKYGKKDIHGASHQRAYYRCTHRDTRGCPAKKHVQQSDDNPSIFNVTYSGTHTCLHTTLLASPHVQRPNRMQRALESDQLLLSFQTGLKVKTRSDSFSFPSTPVNGSNLGCPFSSPPDANYCFPADISSPFISPATSGSNYFSMSSMGRNLDFATQEIDFGEIISGSNSGTNSSMADIDFLIDLSEFDACLDDQATLFTSNF